MAIGTMSHPTVWTEKPQGTDAPPRAVLKPAHGTMARDDVEAGMSVSLILSGVILLGLIGMLVTVVGILWQG